MPFVQGYTLSRCHVKDMDSLSDLKVVGSLHAGVGPPALPLADSVALARLPDVSVPVSSSIK